MMNSTIVRVAALSATFGAVGLAATIADPTAHYLPIDFSPAGGTGQYYDPVGDQTPGSDRQLDMVGSPAVAGMYVGFEGVGSDLTQGTLLFRVRLEEEYSGGTFPGIYVVGIDFNHDGRLDIFVGYDGSGAGAVRYWGACGQQDCTDPSDTTLGTEVQIADAATLANYNYTPVSAGLDSYNLNFDIGNTGATNMFLTFGADFSKIVGYAQTSGFTIDENSAVRFLGGTMAAGSFVDVPGCAAPGSGITWDACGMSAAYAPSDIGAIPEPSTMALGGAGLAALALWGRRRARS